MTDDMSKDPYRAPAQKRDVCGCLMVQLSVDDSGKPAWRTMHDITCTKQHIPPSREVNESL